MALLYREDLTHPALALAQAQRCAQAAGLGVACWGAWVTHEAGPGV